MKEKKLSQDDVSFLRRDIDDDQLVCRGQRHDWGEITPGKPLPRNFRATRHARDGAYRIVNTCRRCSRERVIDTLPHGIYDTNATYTYRSPTGTWKKLPEDSGLTPRDFVAEALRRAMWEGSQGA